MGVLMFKRLLCFMGFHKWLLLKRKWTDNIREDIRENLYGGHKGPGINVSKVVEDKVCSYCRKENFNIKKATERILKEEVIIFEYTKKYEQ